LQHVQPDAKVDAKEIATKEIAGSPASSATAE
jgi:hypothetical protein